MRCPPTIPDEPNRLKALEQYGLSSERPLPSLDPIVRIAVRAFDVPAAAVNMIGSDEVFFAASAGIGDADMRRDVSFCAHAITQKDVMVVEDARLDPRFHDNPLVAGGQVRFYAGAVVRSPDGYALGALCLIDSLPHASFSDHDRTRLKELASLVSDKLELRRIQVAGHSGMGSFERMAMTSPNGIVCVDEGGTIKAMNRAASKIFGHEPLKVVGGPVDILLPTWNQSKLKHMARRAISEQDLTTAVQEDLMGRRRDGSEIPIEVAWCDWMNGDQPQYGLVIRDLTQQRGQEHQIHFLANFDGVTGFPNQHFLMQRLGDELAASCPFSLLVVGLSGFQDILHTLGQSAGSRILQEIGNRLRNCVRPVDFVSALSGEEFAMLLPGIADPVRTATVAWAALAAVTQPVKIDGEEVHVGAHCGITLSPSHRGNAEELIGNANLALQEAQKKVSGSFFLFVPALRAKAVARRMFDAELHLAVERDEFQVYYQPQVRVSDGMLAGAEALLRWKHPERGLLSPAAFLPALDASKLAIVVGNWVIDKACQQAAQWRAELSPSFRMSINLFPVQFRSVDLKHHINYILNRYNLPANNVELEIVENTALDDENFFLPLLHELRNEGINLALDDFGTGYASLSLLNRYPMNHLKIDKSFMQGALESERESAIVKSVTDLAHRLGLQVIAEGVETTAQLNFCYEIGCDEVQGFLIGRPIPADIFQITWNHCHISLPWTSKNSKDMPIPLRLRR